MSDYRDWYAQSGSSWEVKSTWLSVCSLDSLPLADGPHRFVQRTKKRKHRSFVDEVGLCWRDRKKSMVSRRPLASVIDDDESVRESLPDLLKELGFLAHTFSSAEEFLGSDDVYQSRCLILDICMPGMTDPIFSAS